MPRAVSGAMIVAAAIWAASAAVAQAEPGQIVIITDDGVAVVSPGSSGRIEFGGAPAQPLRSYIAPTPVEASAIEAVPPRVQPATQVQPSPSAPVLPAIQTAYAPMPIGAPATGSVPAPATGPVTTFTVRSSSPLMSVVMPHDSAIMAVGLVPGMGLLEAVVAGGLSGLSSEGAGLSLVKRGHIEDPANEIARRIAMSWVEGHGGSLASTGLPARPRAWGHDPIKEISANAADAQFVVTVDHVSLILRYYFMNLNRFGLKFDAKVTVIDTALQKAVASVPCSYDPEPVENGITGDEVRAADAAKVKALIRHRIEACVAKVETELGLPHTPPGTNAAPPSLPPAPETFAVAEPK